MVFGLPFSNALLNIGAGFLVGLAFFQDDALKKAVQFVKHPAFAPLVAFFVWLAVSFFWSTDKDFYFVRLQKRAFYLLLPWSFYVLLPLRKKAFIIVLKSYFWLMAVGVLWSLVYYIFHFNKVQEIYLIGKVMFTPSGHIRFSIMVVIAIVVGFYLMLNHFLLQKNEKKITFLFSLLLIFYLHILSVRSGLLAFYTLTAVMSLIYFFKAKKYAFSLAILLILISLPITAYQFSPTFHNKFKYTQYEFQQYFLGNYTIFGSDMRRLLSMESGIAVGKENCWIGVGYGDIKMETQKKFSEHFQEVPIENYLLPHNQFVFVFAGLGVIGLAMFIMAFVSPFIYSSAYKNLFLISISLIYFTSFFSEYSFENMSLIVYLFWFFLVLFQGKEVLET